MLLVVSFFLIQSGIASAKEKDKPKPIQARSEKGRVLAFVSPNEKGAIEVWDASRSLRLAVLPPSEGTKWVSVALSLDGKLLAAGCDAATVRLWTLATPEVHKLLPVPDNCVGWQELRFSEDGSRLAGYAVKGKTVVVWKTAKVEVETHFAVGDSELKFLSFVPTDTTLLAVGTHECWQWAVGTEKAKKLEGGLGEGADNIVLSPDRLLLAARTKVGIAFWSTAQFHRHEPIETKDKTARLHFLPDGKRFLLIRREAVDIWRMNGKPEDATIERTVEGKATEGFALSPDGKTMAFAEGYSGKLLAVVPLDESGKRKSLFKEWWTDRENDYAIRSLTFTPDGSRIVADRGAGEMLVWDWERSHLATAIRLDASLDQLDFAGDGRTLVGSNSNGGLSLVDGACVRETTPYKAISLGTDSFDFGEIRALDFSPDGKRLAASLSNNETALIELATQKTRKFKFSGFLIRFSKDGSTLCLISEYATALYDMDIDSLNVLKSPAKKPVPADGERLLIGGTTAERDSDARPSIWDPKTGGVAAKFVPKDIFVAGQYALSPDNKKFAALSQTRTDRSFGLEVYDVATETRQSFLAPDIRSYSGLCFSPNGAELIILTQHGLLAIDYKRNKVTRTVNLGAKEEKGAAEPKETVQTLLKPNDPFSEKQPRWRYFNRLAVGPTGLLAARDSYGRISLMDAATFRVLRTLYTPPESGDRGQPLVFSADGNWLASVEHKTIHVFDIRDVKSTANSPKAEAKTTSDPKSAEQDRLKSRAKIEKVLAPLLLDEDPLVREMAENLLRSLRADHANKN